MFNKEQIEDQIYALDESRMYRQNRGCFGSIMRREVDTLRNMTAEQRREWLDLIGMPQSYATEIAKEISIQAYESRMLVKEHADKG